MAWRRGLSGSVARAWRVTLVLLACVCGQMMGVSAQEGADEARVPAAPASMENAPMVANLVEDSYQRVLSDWQQRGIEDTEGVSIEIAGGDCLVAPVEGLRAVPELEGRSGRILEWSAEEGWIEYGVTVPETGLYQVELEYLPLPGRNSSIQRTLRIDGEYQYNELKRLEFSRIWREASPRVIDSLGDEYNPRPVEVPSWQTVHLTHPDGLAAEPLRIFLTAGRHRLRFEAIREPMAIARLRVASPRRLPTYAETARLYAERGYVDAKTATVKVQAEKTHERSSTMIRRVQDREPLTEPHAGKTIVLNALGGEAWRQGGSWVSWRVKVPETGLYRLDIRCQQAFLPDFASGRTLYIDGRIPFAEAAFVGFPYNPNSWQIVTVGGANPYKFYLTAGTHTVTLQVCNAQVGPVIDRVRGVAVDMAFLVQQVLQITGPVTDDPYREWELARQIPGMRPSLKRMITELEDCTKILKSLVKKGQYPQSAAVLDQVSDQLRDIMRDPDSLPRRLKSYRDSQARLGSWVLSLMQQGLTLDYLAFVPPDAPRPRASAGTLHQIWQSAVDLFDSFFRDYTRMGTFKSGGRIRKERQLKIWVAYARDNARILKELADEDFTPRTGIRLDVNVVPYATVFSALILAYNSGRAPDVCMGLWSPYPVEFAFRNAGVDLTRFRDFDEVSRRFKAGSLTPLSYRGGVYALPEAQDFWMLFYRKDILSQLGMDVPQTWDEVFAMIPRLQVRGMDFYYPVPTNWNENREYAPFLFQCGGAFYTEDGRRSALNTPEALRAFEMWTELYTDYNTPIQADFYNRFRTGEMPIGIDDYYMYSRLSAGAPELAGWWQMAPIPGIPRLQDGRTVIDRSMGGYSFACMMFRTTRDKDAAWEFMKWWTSKDVQIQFGTQLEGIIGTEARWNSANVEAMRGLPWPKQDIDAIMEGWQWFKERPVVVGGYITQRYVYNAWNQVVYGAADAVHGSGDRVGTSVNTLVHPREALEDAHRFINRELIRKQREFPEEEEKGQTGGGD
ncbi:MAG: extracellular solute-binding protein [Patescibacteria group bacterium]